MEDYLSRRDHDAYVQRHERDPEAHAAVQRRERMDTSQQLAELGGRVTAVERFQERIMGALILLGVVMGSGIVAVAAELAKK